MIINKRDNKLRKGPGYHLDLLITGIMVIFCSLLGLPWLVAATVRSIAHLQVCLHSLVALVTLFCQWNGGRGDRR